MRKIKFLFLTFSLLLIIGVWGCSEKDPSSLEDLFKDIMIERQIGFDSIWHYEVKDNIIIVFYEEEQELLLGFIENNQGKWEWLIGSGSIDLQDGGYIATAEMGLPFYITAVVNPNEDIKEVVVQEEYAKMVQISSENKIWFAFTDKPSSGINIKEIK